MGLADINGDGVGDPVLEGRANYPENNAGGIYIFLSPKP
jgi:hypothetical protein